MRTLVRLALQFRTVTLLVVGRQDFTVLEPDPHGFDGDNDGVGCES